jgi:hypothetical protein
MLSDTCWPRRSASASVSLRRQDSPAPVPRSSPRRRASSARSSRGSEHCADERSRHSSRPYRKATFDLGLARWVGDSYEEVRQYLLQRLVLFEDGVLQDCECEGKGFRNRPSLESSVAHELLVLVLKQIAILGSPAPDPVPPHRFRVFCRRANKNASQEFAEIAHQAEFVNRWFCAVLISDQVGISFGISSATLLYLARARLARINAL